MILRLYYPVNPFHVNQTFGQNPDYYSRFRDRFGNPEKGHQGIDLQASHGQPVYAACDGTAHYEKDDHGGEGIVIRTDVCDYNGRPATFNVIHWHLIGDSDSWYHSPIPLDGNPHLVKAGDLIGYADNTGAPFESSGDHLHFGLVPFDSDDYTINANNGFNGCIDPMPYFTGTYAQNVPTLISVYQKLILLLRQILGLKP